MIAGSQSVRVFKIKKEDLKSKIPSDVLSKLEDMMWPRLNYLRDRLLNLHQTRSEIVKLDKMRAALPMTYKHMALMYPNSTKSV